MVDTYKRTSNPMMHRPVVKPELVKWMRESQTQLSGEITEVLSFAKNNNIPVIPHETVLYFQMLLSLLRPKRILEIGTAIGFSALVMAQASPEAEIVTIDRNPEMIELAKEVLTELSGAFDIIFMDSAKSKYVEFLPRAMELLAPNGVILMDDIFQAGEILIPIMEIKRNQRALERGLRRLFDEVFDNPKYLTSVLPLGDGLLMIKRAE